MGFITRGRGVSVHRTSCPNVQALREHPERMIEVEWDASGATEFQVEIVVEATDRMGLLKDVTIALSEAGCNILSAATQIVMTKITGLNQQPAAPADGKGGMGTGKFMQWFFPIFSLVICFSYSSAFALYWVAGNLVSMGQTVAINKYLDHKEQAAQGMAGEGSVK